MLILKEINRYNYSILSSYILGNGFIFIIQNIITIDSYFVFEFTIHIYCDIINL